MTRHGTWTETGGSGGWAVGVLAAIVAGVWLASSAKPVPHPSAAGSTVEPAIAGASVHAAAHTVGAGHGVGRWALLLAGVFVALVVVVIVLSAGWQAWTRHRNRPADDSAPAPQAGGSVIVLADYAGRGSGSRRAAGGGAA